MSANNVVTHSDSTFDSKYKIGAKLGHQGSYGLVHTVVRRQTDKHAEQELAVKLLKVPRSLSTSHERVRSCLLKNEIRITRLVQGVHSHQHLVHVHDVFETPEKVYIVMEKCHGGDLFDRIMEYDGKIPQQFARPIFCTLVETVRHLHKHEVLHGDIKLSNIMFSTRKDDTLKLIDFGMSKFVRKTDLSHRIMIGTPNYQAPEIVRGRYGLPADCWSLGVVLFVMVYGFNPFDAFGVDDNSKVVHQRVLDGFQPVTAAGFGPWFPEDIDYASSDNLKDLITKLLTNDQHARLTCEEILSHPWMGKKKSASYHIESIPSAAPAS